MLLRQLDVADERLKSAIRRAGSRPERDPAVAAATTELRSQYRRLLIEHSEGAQAQGVDRHMWMRCFYANIELFRRKARKAKDHLRQRRAGGGREGLPPDPQDEAARESLRRASAGLAKTLDEARSFYEALVSELGRLGGVQLGRLLPSGGGEGGGEGGEGGEGGATVQGSSL